MGDARLLVLGTYRDVALDRRHPLAQVLGDLAREPHYRRVALRGLVEHALAANARMGVRPFLVRTQYEYARMLLARNGRSEDRSRARALLTEAAAAAEEMGLARVLPDVLDLKRQAEKAPSGRRAPRP